MKIIILGAGQVGSTVASELAREETNEITVIDTDQHILTELQDRLDLRTLCGNGSYPNMLEMAGADDADMLIALTNSDEINMVACQIAHSLFNVPTKIARVRQQSYLNPMWADLFSRDNLPIDVIISPELEVAKAIGRRMSVSGAFDMIPLADGKVRVIGVRCTERCPIVFTPLLQLTTLFPDLNIIIVGILRDGEPTVPTSNDQMLPGDEVYFVVDAAHVPRAMAAFGHDEKAARRVVIVGGGNIGLNLARELMEGRRGISTKIIERDRDRARKVAQALPGATIILGDALEADILEEANVSTAETVVAVSNDDETNILASLLAKRSGAGRVVTLINKPSYGPLISNLGIDVVVSPRAITVSTAGVTSPCRMRHHSAASDNFERLGRTAFQNASSASEMFNRSRTSSKER